MLEQKLEALTTVLEKLLPQIELLNQALQAPAVEPVATPTEAIKAEKEAMKEFTPAPTQTEQPEQKTRNDVKDLCMSIVKLNRDLKPKVKEVIESFGGKTIKDIPESELNAVYDALGKI